MSTVLVTGASGFVGSHLVPAIIDAGHDVLALVRDEDAGDLVDASPDARPARAPDAPAR